MSGMRRREFITLVGGAAAWPLAAASAQQSALIGFLNAGAATTLKREIDALRDGLRNLGHIEATMFASSIGLPTATSTGFRLWPQNWSGSIQMSSSPRRCQPIWRSPKPRARFRS